MLRLVFHVLSILLYWILILLFCFFHLCTFQQPINVTTVLLSLPCAFACYLFAFRGLHLYSCLPQPCLGLFSAAQPMHHINIIYCPIWCISYCFCNGGVNITFFIKCGGFFCSATHQLRICRVFRFYRPSGGFNLHYEIIYNYQMTKYWSSGLCKFYELYSRTVPIKTVPGFYGIKIVIITDLFTPQ